MNQILTKLSIILILSLTACKPEKKSDDYYRKQIIGSWAVTLGKQSSQLNRVDTYLEDGTLFLKGTSRSGSKIDNIDVVCSWKILDGFLIKVVEEDKMGNHKKGTIHKREIIDIDKSVLKLINNYSKKVDEHIRYIQTPTPAAQWQ
jgi:hypothetical protein